MITEHSVPTDRTSIRIICIGYFIAKSYKNVLNTPMWMKHTVNFTGQNYM